jgi:hypothetical protein
VITAGNTPADDLPGVPGLWRLFRENIVNMLTGLTGMFTIIGRIRTKCKTGAQKSCQDVRKMNVCKELKAFASVQAARQDVQPV